MYKFIILSVVIAAASAGIIAPAPLGYAGAHLGYAGAPLGYAGAPFGYAQPALGYAHPAPIAHAPIAHAPIVAPAPTNYALPPVREYAQAPIVEKLIEPVEQHGYIVKY